MNLKVAIIEITNKIILVSLKFEKFEVRVKAKKIEENRATTS